MSQDAPTPLRPLVAFGQGCAIALFALTASVHADDTEIFFGQTGPQKETRPNVLFVLDTSGSMNWYRDGTTAPSFAGDTTRISRLKNAMYEILDSSTDINVGLMRFNGGYGGGSVLEPITPIDEIVCRDAFCSEIRIVAQVSGAEADAEENLEDNGVALDDPRLTMGRESGGLGHAQVVGLSFDDVAVPQGARIVSATIEFVADESDNVPSALTIAVEEVDDASPFRDVAADVSDRDPQGSVPWVPAPWVRHSVYESADIAGLVQRVTDRPEWCGTNALNLFIEGSGSRSAMSTARGATNAPKLKVTYDASEIPEGAGCFGRRTVTTPVSAGIDDVTQFFPNYSGQTFSNLNPLRIPRWFSDNDFYTLTTGLRFRDIEVPRDAIVDEAWLTMSSASDSDSSPVEVRIEMQDTDDAPVFTTDDYALSNLPTTGEAAIWTIPPLTTGEEIRSPDLTSMVQAMVNRGGWEPDNAIALLLTPEGGSGRRDFGHAENDAAARLHIRYRDAYVGGRGAVRTARDVFRQSVANLEPEGGTPIAGALLEATRYLTGGAVDYGRTRGFSGYLNYDFDQAIFSAEPQPSGTWSEIGPYEFSSRLHRTSHPASWSGGTLESDCPLHDPSHPDCRTETIAGDATYDSPMTGSCQSNHVVLLSDGQPSGNGAAKRIESLAGARCFGVGPVDEQCGVELARWMQDTDHDPATDGDQNITTYTIGFDLEGNASATDFLKGISSAGGGKHFDGSSSAELVKIFQDIIGEVRTVDTAFVSPGATVNQFNRLTHRDDIYFALFKPAETVRWPGNLKRYKVADEGSSIVIKDVEGKPAVDEESGFFASDSRSFWSDSADGPDVRKGGFAESLELHGGPSDAPREIYTYTGTFPLGGAVDLTADAHALSETNDDITHELLDIVGRDDDYRESLLQWARGVDIQDVDADGSTTDIRHELGDPMHSQPAILNYGATPAENKTTVFISTNQGFLHALDPEVTSGPDASDESIEARELFSWIPGELLDNLDKYYVNERSQDHHYGLDGHMSIWVDDRDSDLTVDPGEQAFVFVGMRRGGSSYYALDVSDRTSPKLAWMIRGGPGGTSGFEQLGQTWSRAVPTRIQIDGEKRDVLVFTGGYDTNQDPGEPIAGGLAGDSLLPLRTTDSRGNALYVVDLRTGELLWSGLGVNGGTELFDGMSYSMPGSPEILDVNYDGLADQVYTSDTGGQVWRFDITPYHRSVNQDGSLIEGGIMARLGSVLRSEERRFYYDPDVALIEKDGKRFASISIGSGWRAHPLNKSVQDRFYVLRTPAIYTKPAGYGMRDGITGSWRPITDADLADADDLSLHVDVDGPGWYKELDTLGEKVLGPSLTINNQVTFTTYMPDLFVEPCSPAIGTGAIYVLDVVSGRPTSDLDGDGQSSLQTYDPADPGDIDVDDDKKLLKHPGLPPPVVAIITEENEGALVGSELQDDPDFGMKTRRTFWTDLSDTPDNADMADLLDD